MHLHDIPAKEVASRVAAFRPDRLVITTAPTYLFWRCAPPELRVPQEALRELDMLDAVRIVVGPHASTTPATTLRKLGADVAVLGECEETLVRLAADRPAWAEIPRLPTCRTARFRFKADPPPATRLRCPRSRGTPQTSSAIRTIIIGSMPGLAGPVPKWSSRADVRITARSARKDNFRDDYRRRALPSILEEIDTLIASGAEYLYFIDEIFVPNRPLLEALVDRNILFGVQTRIDLWNASMLDLLGRAGCVSIEAGVESITVEGRNLLDKGSRLSTEQLAERLIDAKRHVRFVQANLLESGSDDPAEVERWRQHLQEFGVWANKRPDVSISRLTRLYTAMGGT